MSRIVRKIQKIFADITPANSIAQFGSHKAGSTVYSDDLAIIQGLAAWGNGFAGGVVGTNSPPLQDFNGIVRVVTQQLAYLLQRGVPEWEVATDYHVGCFVSQNGTIYVSLQDNNTGHAVTDTNWWRNYLSTIPTIDQRGVAKAWVSFTSAGTVRASYGVTSVQLVYENGYRITWATPFANANYVVQATCGGTAQSRNNYMSIADTPTPVTTTYVDLIENKGGEDAQSRESPYIHVVAFGT